MEDEDLLNVALWEDRATKQWCSLAVFGHLRPSDFGCSVTIQQRYQGNTLWQTLPVVVQ